MCELGLEGVKVNVSKKSSNKEKEIKDLEDPAKLHEENEVAEAVSNATIADTIDLTDTDMKFNQRSSSVIIESETHAEEENLTKDKVEEDHQAKVYNFS